MTQRPGDTDNQAQDGIYRCLAHHRRRRILSILDGYTAPVTVGDLAARIVADESEMRPENVRGDDVKAVQTDLQHVQLPVLQDAGWIEWDRSERAVTKTSHPALRTSAVRTHVPMLDPSWDHVVSALANRRRRLIITLANDRQTPIQRDDLVDALATRERELGIEDVSEAQIRTSLHHQHLPTLAQAGLLEYDHEDATITQIGHPTVEDERFEDLTTERRRPLLESVLP